MVYRFKFLQHSLKLVWNGSEWGNRLDAGLRTVFSYKESRVEERLENIPNINRYVNMVCSFSVQKDHWGDNWRQTTFQLWLLFQSLHQQSLAFINGRRATAFAILLLTIQNKRCLMMRKWVYILKNRYSFFFQLWYEYNSLNCFFFSNKIPETKKVGPTDIFYLTLKMH